jgi:hypothetical protein
MKRILAFLSLMMCAQAYGDIQTWTLQGANLVADDGSDALVVGPVGSLTGRFDYDPATKTITRFQLNAGPSLFSSYTPQIEECDFPKCTGSAQVKAPTHLVFDQNFTEAVDQRLELFLNKPLDWHAGAVILDPQSVIYYNYGRATIHVLGGSISPLSSAAFATPEPATFATLALGLVVVAGLRGSRRTQA